MFKLRADLRKFEAEHKTEFHCSISGFRCLYCPMSFFECHVARRCLEGRCIVPPWRRHKRQ
jgi:hypothetical protein